MSFAALSGDLIKSVFKRLFNMPPHTPWIPFDEIDHSLASMLIAKILFPIPWSVFIFIICIFLVLHLITNVVGYLLKIKEVPY
jgi:CDP-2,3-bis-(O-geranylgeranyl)-sn-glycerol synthase